MNIIENILQWAENAGYAALYANPSLLEVKLGETDFGTSKDGICIFCHLITASDYTDRRESAEVSIYAAALCPFDFEPRGLLQTQEQLKSALKEYLAAVDCDNKLRWRGARFQFGYDDYAENVAWACLRVTLEALAADCIPYGNC